MTGQDPDSTLRKVKRENWNDLNKTNILLTSVDYTFWRHTLHSTGIYQYSRHLGKALQEFSQEVTTDSKMSKITESYRYLLGNPPPQLIQRLTHCTVKSCKYKWPHVVCKSIVRKRKYNEIGVVEWGLSSKICIIPVKFRNFEDDSELFILLRYLCCMG